MRAFAWALLLLLAFTIPWEYSLDFGPPFGNIARTTAVALLLVVIPMLLVAGWARTPGPLQWLVLALFVWFCCSCYWSLDRVETLRQLRAYAQEFMIVWLVWELVDTAENARDLLRAYVAGAWALAALTGASYLMSTNPQQVRFVAEGQDPNDVARYLVLAIPMSALLVCIEARRSARLLAATYLPLGLVAILLTASRSGFLAALVAFVGCDVLLIRAYKRGAVIGLFTLPVLVAGVWIAVPRQTLERLASIPQQLAGGDLNQRKDIWEAGWQTFARAPFFGSGAGTFVMAAGTSPIDTAHNTALALAVEGGIIALLLAAGIVAVSAWGVVRLRGAMRVAMATVLLTLVVGSLTATIQENRVTWLLLSVIAATARLAASEGSGIERALSVTVHNELAGEPAHDLKG